MGADRRRFRAVVAPSFSDIFYNNASATGCCRSACRRSGRGSRGQVVAQPGSAGDRSGRAARQGPGGELAVRDRFVPQGAAAPRARHGRPRASSRSRRWRRTSGAGATPAVAVLAGRLKIWRQSRERHQRRDSMVGREIEFQERHPVRSTCAFAGRRRTWRERSSWLHSQRGEKSRRRNRAAHTVSQRSRRRRFAVAALSQIAADRWRGTRPCASRQRSLRIRSDTSSEE